MICTMRVEDASVSAEIRFFCNPFAWHQQRRRLKDPKAFSAEPHDRPVQGFEDLQTGRNNRIGQSLQAINQVRRVRIDALVYTQFVNLEAAPPKDCGEEGAAARSADNLNSPAATRTKLFHPQQTFRALIHWP